ADLRSRNGGSDRLGNERCRWASLDGALLPALQRLSSKHNNRNILSRRSAFDTVEQIVAAAMLHVVFRDHHVWMSLQRKPETLHAVGGLTHLQVIISQSGREPLQYDRGVIHQQHARHSVRLCLIVSLVVRPPEDFKNCLL